MLSMMFTGKYGNMNFRIKVAYPKQYQFVVYSQVQIGHAG